MSARGVTRAFLFTDLRGFTRLLEERGDVAVAELLDRYRGLVRSAVADCHGAEVKTEGDSFYVSFESPSDAVTCGLRIVREAGGIPVAVGIDAGEALPSGDAYVGGAVNRAARLCALAAAGEVLVSDTVRSLTHTHLREEFIARGTRRLKGVAQPVTVYALGGAATPRARRAILPLAATAGLVVLLVLAAAGGQRLLVGSRPHATTPRPPSPSAPSVPHGALVYQVPFDITGSGFENVETRNQRPGATAVEFSGSGVHLDPSPATCGLDCQSPPAAVALDVKTPALASYVAELDLDIGYAGNALTTFDWVFSRGDGVTAGDHALVLAYHEAAIDYFAPGTVRSADAKPEPLTVPAAIAARGSHSLVVVVDPPRYLAYLDGRQLADACERQTGRTQSVAGMSIVAAATPRATWDVRAIRIYTLAPSGRPPSVGCA